MRKQCVAGLSSGGRGLGTRLADQAPPSIFSRWVRHGSTWHYTLDILSVPIVVFVSCVVWLTSHYANGTESHTITYNFIFARKVQNALHEWLIISFSCFLGNRSCGYQILSQQQATIGLYLREISSLQNSCVSCNRPFSLLLQKSCGNIFWLPYLANFGSLDYL